MTSAPFLIGTPIPPDLFLGRQDLVRIVRQRMLSGESTALVGGPQIGKTSLLLYLAHLLRRTPDPAMLLVEIDCQLLESTYEPADFWAVILDEVMLMVDSQPILAQLARIRTENYSSATLNRLFLLLASEQKRVILLIDEFDALLAHPHFGTNDFFMTLRSLANRTNGLAIVTATRLGLAEIDQRISGKLGSPFSNIFREVRIGPLRLNEARTLAERGFAHAGQPLSDPDLAYMTDASGLHPLLLQAAGQALLESNDPNLRGTLRYAAADAILAALTALHFDDLWRFLSASQRGVLQRLAQHGTAAFLASHWSLSEAADLRELAELGIITSRDNRWWIAASSCARWVLAQSASTPVEMRPIPAQQAEPESLELSLRFVPQAASTEIVWESLAIGRQDSTFQSPYDEQILPVIIRALDALQYPNIADAAPFPIDQQQILRALGYWNDAGLVADCPALIGRALLRSLTSDDQAAAALAEARNAAIREARPLEFQLRFPGDSALLAGLPWELLWEESGPVLFGRGTSIALTRYLDLPQALPPPLVLGQRLRMLAVVPHADLDDLTLADERAARQAALKPLMDSGVIELEELSPVTPQQFTARMQDGPQVDVLHYFGHGRYHKGRGELLFDRQGGGRVTRNAAQIATLLGGVRMVFLHACQSGAFGREGLLTGIAPALAAAGVPAVVAMQLTVRADAALQFIERLYGALAHGESLQRAVARSRQALFASDDANVNWYVPTLTIRSLDDAPFLLVRG